MKPAVKQDVNQKKNLVLELTETSFDSVKKPFPQNCNAYS